MSLITLLGAGSLAFVIWFTWRAYSGQDDGAGGQSRRESIIEAWTNIAIGFSINFTANLFLVPLMTDGGHLTQISNFWGGWIYTAISIVRQFLIRRFFNGPRFAAWLSRMVG